MKMFLILILFCDFVYCLYEDYNSYNGVLFTTGQEISRLRLTFKEPHSITNIIYANDTRHFDIVMRKGFLFCFDRTEKTIFKSQIHRDYKRTLIKDETIFIGGLAVDWIYENVYWTDSKKKTIEIMNYEGDMRKILIQTHLNRPEAIVVDPKKAWMFWTEPSMQWIRRSNMDGSGIHTFLSNTKINEIGLTLDVEKEQVYWVDTDKNEICWRNYKMENPGCWKNKVMTKPSSLAVSEAHVFWSELVEVKKGKIGIYGANKLDGISPQPFGGIKNKRIYDVRVFQMSKQPMSQNYCSKYCSHWCLAATENSSKCICPEKFSLLHNELTCVKGDLKSTTTDFIWFTHETDIRKFSKDTLEMFITVNKTKQATAFDFDIAKGMLFWADWKPKKIYDSIIYKAPIDKPLERTPLLKDQSLFFSWVHSLAVDWIYSHIYWTEAMDGTLHVTDFGGKWCTTLFKDKINSKWGIALNPQEGWMFWSDGDEGTIEKAGMDGSNRTSIIMYDIFEPRDLTLDFKEKRVFWTDFKRNSINSCDYNGNDRKNFLEGLEYSPYTIVTFENWVYWTTKDKIAVFKANKFNGSNVQPETPLHIHGVDKGGMRVHHKSKQPEGTNYCRTLNMYCSHLCLPTPNKMKVTCACSDGFHLLDDGKTCKQDGESMDCQRQFMVEVWITNHQSKDYNKYCSGTIISERWIVTAGSFILSSGGPRYIKVNPNLGSKTFGKFWRVIKFALHPKFEESDETYKHDVALLKISQRITEKFRIHQLNFEKWPKYEFSDREVFRVPTNYCSDKKSNPDELQGICATKKNLPADITPLFCRGGPILENGVQIGVLSDKDDRYSIFYEKDYKDFFLNYTINKHRRFIMTRPFSKSPQKSHLVPFKVKYKQKK